MTAKIPHSVSVITQAFKELHCSLWWVSTGLLNSTDVWSPLPHLCVWTLMWSWSALTHSCCGACLAGPRSGRLGPTVRVSAEELFANEDRTGCALFTSCGFECGLNVEALSEVNSCVLWSLIMDFPNVSAVFTFFSYFCYTFPFAFLVFVICRALY